MEKINNYWVLVIFQTAYTPGFEGKYVSLQHIYLCPHFIGDDVHLGGYTCPRMQDQGRKQKSNSPMEACAQHCLLGGV